MSALVVSKGSLKGPSMAVLASLEAFSADGWPEAVT